MNKNPKPISSYFGENLFDAEKMMRVLPQHAYERLKNVIEHGGQLDLETANIVALAMKDWALGKGCTHYTHWFQPMTGFTAEKHDSFIAHGNNGKVVESFSGRQLTQGEPDASSFPSGGIRATFEARGYTIWDPTSPAFVLEYPQGNTLCIPSIFVSYTGETLDKKAPLLRSIQALNKAALGILKFFNNSATRVFATLGVEQEYFLIDRSYYLKRPDLFQTGRTLFGNAPAKHQQLEDQYFGNIPERAFAFMTEIEQEAYKHGIPLKTRHNEVAPNQFEAAPVFEDVNIAVDHNQILMDMMDRVARRHGLTVLFHEKPFAHINGSGKHCNWSLATDKGENLLDPGKTPQSNLQFLIFLVSTIKAVHDHSRVLRAAVASCANDFRLGANEAPPAIISVFVGGLLTKVLEDLAGRRITPDTDEAWISVGIDKIPQIPKDNTDRNRTSPFAFTGNKFEFRAVGASATPSTAVTVLNTAVADALTEARENIGRLLAKGKDFNTAAVTVLRRMINDSKKVLFEGDNYSKGWEREAAQRGLPNVETTPEALDALFDKDALQLFTKHAVHTEREIHAQYHIEMENYIKQVDIEARITRDMALTMILPAGVKYMNNLTSCADGLRQSLGGKHRTVKSILALLGNVAALVDELRKELRGLEVLLTTARSKKDLRARALAFVDAKTQCENVRKVVDSLEEIVPDEHWPVPKYRDILLTL
jgi:glutamine synthetase